MLLAPNCDGAGGGLVPWIQLETQVNPTEADLEGLAAEP